VNRKEKAYLEILISEIKDLLDSWVKQNDLHPEKVEKYMYERIRCFEEYKIYVDNIFPKDAPHEVVVMSHDEFLEWRKTHVKRVRPEVG